MHSFRALVLALASLLIAAPAAAASGFYIPPKRLPGKRHGDVIRTRAERPKDNLRLRGAARNLRVLYRSTGSSGKAVAVSGAIALPRGRAPKGGFPVLAWAHGTVGIADRCAPTRVARRTDAYTTNVRAQLERYLKAGYAVAATDYEGLGTPGVHPYLVGGSEARGVLDIVRAARAVDPRVGRRVAIMGHSQGGQAALWAAALAPRYTRELRVAGTVAYAPVSHTEEQAGLLDAVTTPTPLSALIAMIFRGLEVAEPSLRVRPLLTEPASALWPHVDRRCLGELARPSSWGGLAPAGILRPGPDRTRLLAAAGANDAERLRIATPVLIAQGTEDATVLPPFTDLLSQQLTARGARVSYRKLTGVDHTGIAQAARGDARAFLRARVGR